MGTLTEDEYDIVSKIFDNIYGTDMNRSDICGYLLDILDGDEYP